MITWNHNTTGLNSSWISPTTESILLHTKKGKTRISLILLTPNLVSIERTRPMDPHQQERTQKHPVTCHHRYWKLWSLIGLYVEIDWTRSGCAFISTLPLCRPFKLYWWWASKPSWPNVTLELKVWFYDSEVLKSSLEGPYLFHSPKELRLVLVTTAHP